MTADRVPTIIVPVHDAFEAVRECMESLLDHGVPGKARLLLIDDASQDPRVAPLLRGHARAPGVSLLTNDRNRGYTATVNAGIAWAGDDDVILLNSDARVTRGWLEGLLSVAGGIPRSGTVTAMSDHAGAFSFPVPGQANPPPEGVDCDAYAAALLAGTSRCDPVEVPTGSGFCMWIRRALIDEIGGFDEAAFPRGYGEENDFCMRALARGWRHFLSPRSFVFHRRSASFGAAREALVAQGDAVLRQRYPDYHARVAEAFSGPSMARLRAQARAGVGRLARSAPSKGPVASTRTLDLPALVRESGLFDEAWYLARYRDVERLEMTPLEHYLRFGTLLGRLPGPAFDARRYLQDHPDVEASGMNPLVHYVRHGREEGRRFWPLSGRGPSAAGARQAPKLPLTALVVTWDVGHNPLGRSYMLAEVLDRVVRNVVVAGFQFERYGNQVWEPVRHGSLPVVRLPGVDFPQFLDQLDRLAQRLRPDIVFACKPRLPSLQLGAMIKHRWHCPLVLDIDDHELAFFGGGAEATMEQLAAMPAGEADAHAHPFGEFWTRLSQGMRGFADATIVSNAALQRVFGGTIVPHVRDERTFDPALADGREARERFGVPADARVVLFFGTPRQHKGVDVLARAVGQIGDPAFRLVVVGTPPDRGMTEKLQELAKGRVVCLPNQPFSEIPHVLSIADVVCLPQDVDHPVSQFQLPAKAVDAIAMGVPLLVSPTPPLLQLVEDGVAEVFDPERLPQMLVDAVRDRQPRADASRRERFLRGYSHQAAADLLRGVIAGAQRDADHARVAKVPDLLAAQRRLFGPSADRAVPDAGGGRDVVVFWKQNDSGLYGRRSDMVVKYLASRPDVRRVVLFDAPISEHELLLHRNRNGVPTHDRLVYTRTYEKLAGARDHGKVVHGVFTTPPGKYRVRDDGTVRPLLADAYHQYIGEVLAREGIDAAKAVFWFYPKNFLAPSIIDRFSPAAVVVDVVDDHRAWPNVGEAERKALTANYRQLLACADMAFANCEPVVQAMRPMAEEIRLVPNGCDPMPAAGAPAGTAFAEFAAFTGKTIGFVGNLEKKIDVPLLAEVARRFPQCQLVLLGSTHANPDVLVLRDLPNVRMPGVVPYDEVGAWISRFDVGLIPHLDMPLTRSMNPLKLYVYLSAGVPVVSTAVDNVDGAHAHVHVAGSREAFLDTVARVLAAGRPASAEFADYVNANSWAARLGPHIDELFGGLDA